MNANWNDLYNRYLTRPELLVTLMAHAWRQAVECGDEGLWSTLYCNSYSVAGMCGALTWRGVYPDERTMQWAVAAEDRYAPVVFTNKMRPI